MEIKVFPDIVLITFSFSLVAIAIKLLVFLDLTQTVFYVSSHRVKGLYED